VTAAQFIERFPYLWHTGRAGMWEAARRDGLLSVSAILDAFGLRGAERLPYESQRRSRAMLLEGSGGRRAWLRDQGPLAMPKLAKLLDGGMTCEDWLHTLNGRVYFWCREARLETFLMAYRDIEQDVITISTPRLIDVAGPRIELAHLNTGATRFMTGRRGPETFQPVDKFAYPPSRVVEVTCLDRLEGLEEIANRVERVHGAVRIKTLFERAEASG